MSAWPKELQELGETAAKVERLAITIHNLKQQSIECDAKRQKTVEALAQIRKMKKDPEQPERAWVLGGPVFMHLKIDTAELSIKQDQEALNETIESIRQELKRLVKELLELAPDKHMDKESLKLLLRDTQ